MDRIASKQIDGVVDLTTFQQVTARKQFDGGVGASNGLSSHYPILSGGYLYWVASPTRFPADGDYRLGVTSANILRFEVMQNGAWVNYCTPACTSPSGCLTYGTKILMSDGSQRLIEEIELGDEVLTVSLPGLGTDPSDWQSYRSTVFAPLSDYSTVTGILRTQSSYYYRINEQLQATFEHPILIQRNLEFQFLRAEDLMPGDQLFHYLQGWVTLETLERVNEPIRVVNINVDSKDTYFADLFLVHNLDNPVSSH